MYSSKRKNIFYLIIVLFLYACKDTPVIKDTGFHNYNNQPILFITESVFNTPSRGNGIQNGYDIN